jgi:hypothetical protein
MQYIHLHYVMWRNMLSFLISVPISIILQTPPPPPPSLDPAAHHPLSCPNYSWQFKKKIFIYMLLFWSVYFYETGFNNRVGTGVGNVSAFKIQVLYNRIGKVSGFFLIDISIISNTKNDTSPSYNNTNCFHDRRHYYIPWHSHSFTRKHETIPLQTIMNNIFLKNLVLAFIY